MVIARFRWFLSLLALAVSFGAAAAPDFDQLEQRLKIRPEQKEQFDITVGATKRAMLAVAMAAMQLKEKLAAELAKNNPDFRAFARSNEDLIEQTRPAFREAGDQWKKLYALLDDEQVQVAKQFLHENLGRLISNLPGTPGSER